MAAGLVGIIIKPISHCWCPLTQSRSRAWWPGPLGAAAWWRWWRVLMVSTLWALPVLRPVILTRREGDKGQPVTVSLSILPDQDWGPLSTYLLLPPAWLELVGFPGRLFSVPTSSLSLVSCLSSVSPLAESGRRDGGMRPLIIRSGEWVEPLGWLTASPAQPRMVAGWWLGRPGTILPLPLPLPSPPLPPLPTSPPALNTRPGSEPPVFNFWNGYLNILEYNKRGRSAWQSAAISNISPW